MAVGQIVGGVKTFHVPQLEKIRMGEIAMDVVSPAMLYARTTIRRRHPITRPQLPRVLVVLYLAITVGVKRMKLSP